MKRASIIKIIALIGFGFLWTAPVSWAQQVYWSPASGTLQQGKANRLQLHFEGCSPDGAVSLPQIAEADFSKIGQSSSMNIFNSRVVQKLILEFQASPTSKSTVKIPAFTVKTDKGDITVAEANFEVVEATVGNTGMKPEDIFKSELSATEESIYEGQIFNLRYVLGVRQDYQNNLNDISPPQWNPVGVVTQGFESHRSTTFKFRNHNYAAILFETPAMATRNGSIKLPKVNQTVSMIVGRRKSFIFDDPVVDNYNIASDTLQLDIKPLPTGAPPAFKGAVGQFDFESTIVPEIVQVGEPVTWTLTLNGTGNWPQGIGINPRNVSASFRSIQPDVNKEISEESPFEGSLTEDIVLIPTEGGDFKFGPVEFSYFNPKTDQYETINVPERTIVVNPLVDVSQPNIPQPVLGNSDEQSVASGTQLDFELDPIGVNLLSKPIEMLSAPSAAVAASGIPQGGIKLRYLTLSFAAPAMLWVLIALIRSIIFDPNKARRQAFKELKATSLLLDDTEPQARAAQLSWRDAAKRFWGIETEEPSSEDIQNAVSHKADPAQAERWKTLWQGSDRILFGKRPPSFKDWQSDLREAMRSQRKPGVSINRLFSSKAWFAVLAFGFLLFSFSDGFSDDGLGYYNGAAFEKAEASWKADLEKEPYNWAIRHNLGLAVAQQEQWGEAVAFWTSAFLLNTKSPELNWDLKVALSKSGAYYPVLGRLVKGDGIMAYIALLTPAQWERASYIAMIIAGVAFSVWVAFACIYRLKRLQFALAVTGLVSVASVFGADWARREYGLLANPDAVVAIIESTLRSVPTDLEVEQIESSLPEGSICLVSKQFPGWVKVELPNGEQGWSRKENFAPLYGKLLDRFQYP
ncbi:MAG: hypothetical protein HN763_07705 [Opitutales bacterium]|jgi:hypothetical protein|nr:hypothetical protein [Opitutales bacterium]MBT7866224.1 hypothetical protein [Opitutales bacterium]